jgi:quercetin dioxygenase-like cupin family protein
MSTDMNFSVSMARDAKFETGLRAFLEYRDLGIKAATHGRFRAHVIRVKKGEDHGLLHTTGLHRHKLEFQMIFILKGWIKFTYEGHGEHTFGPGDCCLQPPGIVHNELDCSDDLELLEITSPGDFETVALKA